MFIVIQHQVQRRWRYCWDTQIDGAGPLHDRCLGPSPGPRPDRPPTSPRPLHPKPRPPTCTPPSRLSSPCNLTVLPMQLTYVFYLLFSSNARPNDDNNATAGTLWRDGAVPLHYNAYFPPALAPTLALVLLHLHLQPWPHPPHLQLRPQLLP